MIDRLELGAWLRLTETPQLGRESARKLLAAFGSPEAAIAATTAAAIAKTGVKSVTTLGRIEASEGLEAGAGLLADISLGSSASDIGVSNSFVDGSIDNLRISESSI